MTNPKDTFNLDLSYTGIFYEDSWENLFNEELETVFADYENKTTTKFPASLDEVIFQENSTTLSKGTQENTTQESNVNENNEGKQDQDEKVNPNPRKRVHKIIVKKKKPKKTNKMRRTTKRQITQTNNKTSTTKATKKKPATTVTRKKKQNIRKLNPEERKLIIMERNRINARKCRERKKQYVENLETQTVELINVNTSLNTKVELVSKENSSLRKMLTFLQEQLV
ncbi:cyclic-amp response element binding protein [Anaeramoeba flamelloides]|uniref:Cyclic-amp response element binding protein n=1 Tax=Anaeramoeba flamelloides TaxID=1746091 RepID=A0AAV7YU75_9EUKA|nr:cyclic-amp response element binding protein [Anaeramoeba flamelloides]